MKPNAFKAALWIAAVCTGVIFGSELLTLYKMVEFHAAVPGRVDFALIIMFCSAVVLAAALALVALSLVGASSPQRTRIGRLCSVASTGLVAAVLLMNFLPLHEWPREALEGRNYSAAWCLLASAICLFAAKRRTE